MPPTLNAESHLQAARYLDEATHAAREVDRLSSRFPTMNLEDAYAIQRAGMFLREQRGARRVGWKMGLTSVAKRAQMGLDSAIFGYLHDEGSIKGSRCGRAGLIHPKAEPEIGFRLKTELKGRVSFEQAIEAIGGVCAAIEIIDSRYVGFKYFSLPDVVADNCSAGRFVWGEELTNFRARDLDRLTMAFEVNGTLAHSAQAGEISGHPVNSLVQLAAMLEPFGEIVPAGAIVLAGAATPAVALEAGQKIELKIDQLPQLRIEIE